MKKALKILQSLIKDEKGYGCVYGDLYEDLKDIEKILNEQIKKR